MSPTRTKTTILTSPFSIHTTMCVCVSVRAIEKKASFFRRGGGLLLLIQGCCKTHSPPEAKTFTRDLGVTACLERTRGSVRARLCSRCLTLHKNAQSHSKPWLPRHLPLLSFPSNSTRGPVNTGGRRSSWYAGHRWAGKVAPNCKAGRSDCKKIKMMCSEQ